MKTTLADSYILVKPSNKLLNCIDELKDKENMQSKTENSVANKCITSSKDFSFISTIHNKLKDETSELLSSEINTYTPKDTNNGYLHIEELFLLNEKLETLRKNGSNSTYLHDLLKDASIYVPGNEQIERNPELEKRCASLKIRQDNKKYRSMTKSVDNVRLREPEETISYQVKQINKQLIAVAQFVISVLAAFTFGFTGIGLMENVDLGFKLLLGIVGALTVGLAELYFLAKQIAD